MRCRCLRCRCLRCRSRSCVQVTNAEVAECVVTGEEVRSREEVKAWSTFPFFPDRVEQGEQRIKRKKKKVKKKKQNSEVPTDHDVKNKKIKTASDSEAG